MSKVENGKTGGTPPPCFLKTNSEMRRRGGQPGNRNAVKHGQHTAEMRALRAEVRFAVQKAKSLAAAAWNLKASAAVVRRKEAPLAEQDDAMQSQIG